MSGDKKQVSIVECDLKSNEGARKKREKFKRQDTPLHPDTATSGSMKQLSIPKSLSINVNTISSHPSSCMRAISYGEQQKSPTPLPLGQATMHKKTQNLTSSPRNSANIPKLETAPR